MKLVPPVSLDDKVALRRHLQKLASKLGPEAVPTFAELTLTGLTASTLVGANASKLLESVTVGSSLDYTRPTLNTIQDIRTSASPTFAGLTLTNAAVIGSNSVVFQPGTDSTTFFQVLDADGGTPILNVDTTNERVGIRNNAPTTALDVTGTGTFSDLLVRDNAAGSTRPLEWFPTNATNNYLEIGGAIRLGLIGSTRIDAIDGVNDSFSISAAGTGALLLNRFDGTGGVNIYAGTSDILARFTNAGWLSIGIAQPARPFHLLVNLSAADEIISPMLLDVKREAGITTGGGGFLIRGFGASGIKNWARYGSFRDGGDDDGQAIITVYKDTVDIHAVVIKSSGNIGFNETSPETLTEWTSTAPYLTLHNSTHEDTDGGGESRFIFKREDGAGTETAAGQIEISHDGVVANDQLGKVILSVNTGAGLVQALEIGSDLLATFAGAVSAGSFTGLVIGTDIQAWDAGLDSLAGLTYASDSFIKVTAENTYAIRTIAETKTDLSLNLVENTTLSTWAGTTNITTLGTIATIGNITIAGDGTIGQAAGPLLTFDDTNNYLEITGCNVGIGTTTPISTANGLDISSGGLSLIIGADNLGSSRTDTTEKHGRFGIMHYTNIEEPLGILLASSGVNYSYVHFGGGSGLVNAATELRFYTAANTITTTGTVRATITNTNIKLTLPVFIKEQAAAGGDIATYGQLWVKTATPNVLMFTNDAGTDFTVDVTAV